MTAARRRTNSRGCPRALDAATPHAERPAAQDRPGLGDPNPQGLPFDCPASTLRWFADRLTGHDRGVWAVFTPDEVHIWDLAGGFHLRGAPLDERGRIRLDSAAAPIQSVEVWPQIGGHFRLTCSSSQRWLDSERVHAGPVIAIASVSACAVPLLDADHVHDVLALAVACSPVEVQGHVGHASGQRAMPDCSP